MLCVGESTDDIVFATTNTDGTTTYEWTNDNTDIGLYQMELNIPSFMVTGSSLVSETATIEVATLTRIMELLVQATLRPLPLRLTGHRLRPNGQVLCVGESTDDIVATNNTAQLLQSDYDNTVLAWLQMELETFLHLP